MHLDTIAYWAEIITAAVTVAGATIGWRVLHIRAWLSGHRPVSRAEHDVLACRLVRLEGELDALKASTDSLRQEAIGSDQAVMESVSAAHERIDRIDGIVSHAHQ